MEQVVAVAEHDYTEVDPCCLGLVLRFNIP